MSDELFPYQSIYEYFDAHLEVDATDEAYARARKEYWREYRKRQQRTLRFEKKTVTLHLTPKEYVRIKDASQKLGISISRFAKISTLQCPELVPPSLRYACLKDLNEVLALLGNDQSQEASVQALVRVYDFLLKYLS